MTDFIRDKVQQDLDSGKYSQVVTRFPPEPNGYLHIGHAKSICLNFGVAEEFGGRCHLRYDDTNPATEDPEYVDAIQHDVRWLGYDWGEHLYYASDYFERMAELAIGLIEDGKAYVDSQSGDEIRENRGSITQPGTPSPYRDRPVDENLDLFARMRTGEFEDGSHVLRAKIDMASANMLMRDPLLYRIRNLRHYRQGDARHVYPMYDYAHCLEDAFEGVTHSLCTLEFENNRELYDWVLDATGFRHPRPQQTEFARLNLSYTVTSKRKLLQLVREDHVSGWDDPRMPTLSGLRRGGYTAESIRAFCQRVGVARNFNIIDIGQLEFSIRDDLNHRAPRVMAVLKPLEVVIENWPEDEFEELEAPYWPHDVPNEGSRNVPFGRRLLIERDDFSDDPPAGWYRLAPGAEVRLRYAYIIRCNEVVRDAAGVVSQLRCTYDPDTRGGQTTDGRKVAGTLHWLAADRALACEVRLYDRLFSHERPDAEGDFLDHLNANSLEVLTDARVEPSVADLGAGEHLQFERQGYFFTDPIEHTDGRLVFNRTVTLRDSWAKLAGEERAEEAARIARLRAEERAAHKAEQRRLSEQGGDEPQLSTEQQQAAQAFEASGLSPHEAMVLVRDGLLTKIFERAVATYDGAKSVAGWVINDLQRVLKERSPETRADGAEDIAGQIAELAKLVDDDRLTATAARELFADMIESGDSPAELMSRRGLEKLDDTEAVGQAIASVLAAHPDELAAYRGGKKALLGFFIGQAMRATSGKADAQTVRQLLAEQLG